MHRFTIFVLTEFTSESQSSNESAGFAILAIAARREIRNQFKVVWLFGLVMTYFPRERSSEDWDDNISNLKEIFSDREVKDSQLKLDALATDHRWSVIP